jgi:hypothetical protein
MLESAKDQVLGVDTLRQQVPPRVRYETTCLLIKDAVGSVQERPWYHLLPREILVLLWYYVLP